jgi:hypothetical protein
MFSESTPLSLIKRAFCLAALVLLLLTLPACWPLPVQDDKYPELPTLSQLKSTDKVLVTQLLASADVEAIVIAPRSGKLLVHIAPRVTVKDNDGDYTRVEEENLLIFDLASVQPKTPLKVIRAKVPEEKRDNRAQPWLIDAQDNIYFMGSSYAAPDYTKVTPVEILSNLQLAEEISKETGVPVVKDYSGVILSDQEREAKFGKVLERYKALGQQVTAFDYNESLCWLQKLNRLIENCVSGVSFGEGSTTPPANFGLIDFIPKSVLQLEPQKQNKLCDSGIAECWDKAVAANHCSGNHMVFGCSQSYRYYADLSVGAQKMRFKSVPDGDDAFAFQRIDARRVVAASSEGVYLIGER